MDNILFISHDANRTGAPIVLLHLLRWLKKQNKFTFSIILLRGGELENEFHEIAPTYIWYKSTDTTSAPSVSYRTRVWNKLRNRIGNADNETNRKPIIIALKKSQPKLIYANTIVTSEIAVLLKQELICPAVCHVHELAIAIEGYFGTTRFGKVITDFDLLIAASESVKNNLITTYSIKSDKVVKVYEFINQIEVFTDTANTRNKIFSSLNIPEKANIVVASGTFEWRKSPSLFIQVADYMRKNMDKIPYFLWVGGNINSLTWKELQYDIERLGLTEHVKFIGSQQNLPDYLQIADVFLLTSREDPYPLVCLEAAMLAKPIVCFEDSGGMPEFVENDCGIVVPFLQVDIMAEAVQELLINSNKRYELGSNAHDKVTNKHNVKIAGQEIVSIIENIIQN